MCTQGSRHVSLGASQIPSGTKMNMSFVNNTLRLRVEAYEFGFVVLNEQVIRSFTRSNRICLIPITIFAHS